MGRKVGDFRNADIRFKQKAGNDLFLVILFIGNF